MRAVVLRDGRLEVRETDDPVPGEGELLLRTRSTAICASDVHFMDHHDALPEGSMAEMVYDADRDIVLGHEFVGEVVGHGPGCSDGFPVGTRVTAMPILLTGGGAKVIGQHPEAQGSFGELLVVCEAMARAVPDGVSDDAVALVDAFERTVVEPGDFDLLVGGSSRDADLLSARLTVEGERFSFSRIPGMAQRVAEKRE